MADQPLFHVLLATAEGLFFELDVRALSADHAATLAADDIRMGADVPVLVTNVHVRRISGSTGEGKGTCPSSR